MLLTALGLWAVGKKLRWGFISGFISCIIWIAYGLEIDSWGIILGNTLFGIMNLKGYINWSNDAERREA